MYLHISPRTFEQLFPICDNLHSRQADYPHRTFYPINKNINKPLLTMTDMAVNSLQRICLQTASAYLVYAPSPTETYTRVYTGVGRECIVAYYPLRFLLSPAPSFDQSINRYPRDRSLANFSVSHWQLNGSVAPAIERQPRRASIEQTCPRSQPGQAVFATSRAFIESGNSSIFLKYIIKATGDVFLEKGN